MKSSHVRSRFLLALCAGALAPFALALAIAAYAAAPLKNATYKGTTSEHGAVSFKVSANGKKLLNFTGAIGYNGKCGQGGGPGYVFNASIAIGRAGRFSGVTEGRLSTIKPVQLKISGAINGHSASGTIEKPGLRCKSGPHPNTNPYSESFTARAR